MRQPSNWHPYRRRRLAQGAVEAGEREAPALRQFEIGGIVNCQAMLLGELDGRRPDVGRFVDTRYNLGSPFIMSASDLLKAEFLAVVAEVVAPLDLPDMIAFAVTDVIVAPPCASTRARHPSAVAEDPAAVQRSLPGQRQRRQAAACRRQACVMDQLASSSIPACLRNGVIGHSKGPAGPG